MSMVRKKPHIGEKYNHLTVVEQLDDYVTPGGTKFSYWLCKCDCGNQARVLGASLTSGHTKSCGCLSKRAKIADENMLGKKFGMLTVIRRAPSHKIPSGSVYDMWYCMCDCGRTTVSFGRNLRRGTTQSCGCDRVKKQAQAKSSKAEIWTKQYLKEKNVSYEYQKTFADLISPAGFLLSYDFYLPDNNTLVELNGLQHYKAINRFGGEEMFRKQVLFDNMKLNYAVNNDYKLVIIDTDRITQEELLSKLDAIFI